MKIARLSLLSLGLLVAASALGHEASDEVIVCQRDSQGQCQWVSVPDPARAPAPALAPPLAPGASDFDRWYRPNEVYERPAVVDPSAAASSGYGYEQGRSGEVVEYDWQVVSPEFDPTIGKPGACASTPSRARYHFVAAMESGDLNKVMAIYDWHDKTEDQATPIIERLGTIPRNGQWEQAIPSASFGGDGTFSAAPLDRWRWEGDGQVFYFNMVEQSGCWSIAFAAGPGSDGSFVAPRVDGQPPSQPPSTEPQEIAPGVIEF